MRRDLYLKKFECDGLTVQHQDGLHATIMVERFDAANVFGRWILWTTGTNESFPHPGPEFRTSVGETVILKGQPKCSFTVQRIKPERVIIDLTVPGGTDVRGPVMREVVMLPDSNLLIGQKTILRVESLLRKKAEVNLEKYRLDPRGRVGNTVLFLRSGKPDATHHTLVPDQELDLNAEGDYLVVHYVTPGEFAFYLKTGEKTELR